MLKAAPAEDKALPEYAMIPFAPVDSCSWFAQSRNVAQLQVPHRLVIGNED